MIPIKQTIPHNPPEQNGNCFAAVIASITHIPIDEVLPVQDMFDKNDWHIHLFCWLKERGWLWRGAPEFGIYYHEYRRPDYIPTNLVKDIPYLVTGKTNRFEGTVDHVCVFMNGEMIHDPHPDNTGLTTLEHFEVIEPINLV